LERRSKGCGGARVPVLERRDREGQRREPHAYLSLLLTRLPHATTVEHFEALLPRNVKAGIAAVA
jgi:hypothetical protein